MGILTQDHIVAEPGDTVRFIVEGEQVAETVAVKHVTLGDNMLFWINGTPLCSQISNSVRSIIPGIYSVRCNYQDMAVADNDELRGHFINE